MEMSSTRWVLVRSLGALSCSDNRDPSAVLRREGGRGLEPYPELGYYLLVGAPRDRGEEGGATLTLVLPPSNQATRGFTKSKSTTLLGLKGFVHSKSLAASLAQNVAGSAIDSA